MGSGWWLGDEQMGETLIVVMLGVGGGVAAGPSRPHE